MKTNAATMDALYEQLCKFKQKHGKDPTHIYMGNKVFNDLCDELKFCRTFKDEHSDGKDYFMGIEIVTHDVNDYVGLSALDGKERNSADIVKSEFESSLAKPFIDAMKVWNKAFDHE